MPENTSPLYLPSPSSDEKGSETRKPPLFSLLFAILLSLSVGILGGGLAFLFLWQDLIAPLSFKPQQVIISSKKWQEGVSDIVGVVSKGVVSIVVYDKVPVYETYYINPFGELSPFDFLIPRQRLKGYRKEKVGSGTGFFIDKKGLIVTNKHVVNIGQEYEVVLWNGKTLKAELVAKDPLFDIAFLQVKEGVPEITPLRLGDSEKVKIGEFVIAVGYALGEFQNSVSFGIVSGLGRRVVASGAREVEVLEGIIQTDAAINKGNSGGPLVNLRGEVIGMNTAVAVGAENIGFAIPINRIKADLRKLSKYGKIVYPFLGVYYESSLEGALVKEVIAGTPAQKAGLQKGDVIVQMGSYKIDNVHPLSSVIVNFDPGDTVILKVKRGGKILDISVTLEEFKE